MSFEKGGFHKNYCKCTIGQKKKKKRVKISNSNTNYRREMKLVPINMNYCLL